jgi:RinA family phage transcriptional activator
MRLKRAAYRHIEAEIYAYHDTLKEITRRRQDIILGGDTEIRPAIGASGYSGTSTVERRATKLADSLLLREMERITAAIENSFARLDEEKKKAIEYKYWGNGKDKRPAAAAQELNIDETTLRRWRGGFVYSIAEQLGWW